MTSLVLHPQHECAPRAIRTAAMACAMSLNLAVLLIALRPLPLTIALPSVPKTMQASVLQENQPIPLPPMPVLQPVRHVARPTPARQVTQPVTVAPITTAPNPVATTEPSTIPTPVAQPTAPVASSGSTDATIAYETATPPPYPIVALRNGVQGTVLLRVLVDEHGKPVQVLIERSSGSRVLDQAARRHVLAAWYFHPAQRDGHTIQAWAEVPVEFKLSGA